MKELYYDCNAFLRPYDLIVLKESKYDALPEIEVLEASVTGRNGNYHFGTRYKDRFINLELQSLQKYTPDTIGLAWREYAREFSPQSGWMKYKRFDSPDVYGEVKVIKTYQFEREPNNVFFSVSFLLKDGVYKTEQEFEVTGNGEFQEIYVDCDFDTPVFFETSDNAISKKHTFTRIDEEGQSETFALTIDSNGAKIDGYRGIVTKKKKTDNIMDKLEGNIWYLKRGKNRVKIPQGFTMKYREWRLF